MLKFYFYFKKLLKLFFLGILVSFFLDSVIAKSFVDPTAEGKKKPSTENIHVEFLKLEKFYLEAIGFAVREASSGNEKEEEQCQILSSSLDIVRALLSEYRTFKKIQIAYYDLFTSSESGKHQPSMTLPLPLEGVHEENRKKIEKYTRNLLEVFQLHSPEEIATRGLGAVMKELRQLEKEIYEIDLGTTFDRVKQGSFSTAAFASAIYFLATGNRSMEARCNKIESAYKSIQKRKEEVEEQLRSLEEFPFYPDRSKNE